MATLTFHGAAQEVTGSCHLLESPALGRVLLDCGLHQGGDAVERMHEDTLPFDPQHIDAVVLSHAHLDHSGRLPLLAPMSAIAGRMSIQAGAHALEATQGGAGLLLGGVPGVRPGKVVIIGGGVVGENAAEMAVGLGADVTVLDRSPAVLEALARRFAGRVRTVYSTKAELEASVYDADLVIGAVLVKGARAPHLVTRDMLGRMRPGSVIVDVAVDQGGCFETTRATTHTDPTYVVDGIVHYCVANMPGAVSRTSTLALSNATLPFALALADKGTDAALKADHNLLNGLNVCAGQVTDRAVADTFDMEYVDPIAALARR